MQRVFACAAIFPRGRSTSQAKRFPKPVSKTPTGPPAWRSYGSRFPRPKRPDDPELPSAMHQALHRLWMDEQVVLGDLATRQGPPRPRPVGHPTIGREPPWGDRPDRAIGPCRENLQQATKPQPHPQAGCFHPGSGPDQPRPQAREHGTKSARSGRFPESRFPQLIEPRDVSPGQPAGEIAHHRGLDRY